jgi:hypothetical protein
VKHRDVVAGADSGGGETLVHHPRRPRIDRHLNRVARRCRRRDIQRREQIPLVPDRMPATKLPRTIDDVGVDPAPRDDAVADAPAGAAQERERRGPRPTMEVDRQIVVLPPQFPAERDVGEDAADAAAPRHDDHFVEVRVGRDNRRCRRLDQVGEVRIGEPAAQGGDGRGREHDVADLPQADQQNLQGSMLASSISMTGMSSLIG